MGSTTVSAGKRSSINSVDSASKDQISESIGRLSEWLEKHDYRGYDTFDGLSAKFVRPLTFETKLLRTVLQQGVRRFPLNLRPLLGIPTSRSTKGMSYIARGYMRLEEATGDKSYGDKARSALQWLIENQSKGYSGACWGNHFDYQSRGFYLPKGVPTIVWTSHIGHGFLDAYEHFGDEQYLQVAASACQHILRDLKREPEGDTVCISYIPTGENYIHNANVLGGSLLARTYSYTKNAEKCLSLAKKAMQYTANHQRGKRILGITARLRAYIGWIIFILPTYWIALNITPRRRVTSVSKPTSVEDTSTGRTLFSCRMALLNTTITKRCRLTSNARRRPFDSLVFFNDRDPGNLVLAFESRKMDDR